MRCAQKSSRDWQFVEKKNPSRAKAHVDSRSLNVRAKARTLRTNARLYWVVDVRAKARPFLLEHFQCRCTQC